MNQLRVFENWDRFLFWARQHLPLIRMVCLISGLVIFLVLLPASMRAVFWDGLSSHLILAGMLLIFSLLELSLLWSVGQDLDTWIFLVFNVRGARPIWLDQIMLGFTQIGSGFAVLGIALLLFLFKDRLLSYELVLGTLTLWLVVELVKFLVHRGRPFIQIVEARIVGYRAVGRSFPSGHTSQAFFMATLMVQHFHANVWLVLVLYTGALLVGITRIYVGAHYPRDVLAGAMLGSAWGLLGVIVDGYVLSGLR
jgi:membrane-associated phospholipid phosphatase